MRVYMLQCSDGSYYTGVSQDVAKRLRDHNISRQGAKYVKPRRPVSLVWVSTVMEKNDAMFMEAKIKKLSRSVKVAVANWQLTPVVFRTDGLRMFGLEEV